MYSFVFKLIGLKKLNKSILNKFLIKRKQLQRKSTMGKKKIENKPFFFYTSYPNYP